MKKEAVAKKEAGGSGSRQEFGRGVTRIQCYLFARNSRQSNAQTTLIT